MMPQDPAGHTNHLSDAHDAERPLVRMGGGANQTGARAYNDRLILSLLRRAGPLPKAELSRRTGLSAQTLTVIVKRLEREHLLRPEEPVRGRVGQPSVPYSLNPDAVFSYGLKIGRRSMELALCDFTGAVRAREIETGTFPTPQAAMRFVTQAAATLCAALPPACRNRVIGAGVAMPFEIWNWAEQVDAPPGAPQAWRDFDIEGEAGRALGLPVILCNDATAACAAEVFSADGLHEPDFLYVYVGWFIGGGLTLNGALFGGRTGNAGAIGSALVAAPGGGAVPLMEIASVVTLERELRAQGRDPSMLRADAVDWSAAEPFLGRWTAQAARAIAQASIGAASVLDVDVVCIDGAVPAPVRAALARGVAEAITGFDTRGIAPLRIVEGRHGADARPKGAALLPIIANFTRDRAVLVKDVSV